MEKAEWNQWVFMSNITSDSDCGQSFRIFIMDVSENLQDAVSEAGIDRCFFMNCLYFEVAETDLPEKQLKPTVKTQRYFSPWGHEG